jgi:hypothetical protein
MKRIFIIAVVIAFGCSTKSQVNQEIVSNDDETILIGEINWDGLNQEPYSEWFGPNYLEYQVDSETLDFVGNSLDDVEIVMFLGTWCSDSQLEVPQFYRILDYVNYDVHAMKVYALERKWEPRRVESPSGIEKEYNVEFVPTMIFYRDGTELGRITEYPKQTLEKDLLEIAGQ